MFRRALSLHCATLPLLQKKQSAASYMANAGKVGGEEKWAQAAMEFIYEKNHVNDSRKREGDVQYERKLSEAFDRYCAINEKNFQNRMERLIVRMNEVLEVLNEGQENLGGLPTQDYIKNTFEGDENHQNDKKYGQLLEEAILLNSEQPPGHYRRPSLTPPLIGYEPGFGLDVPQLKSEQMEYPRIIRPTDRIEFSAEEKELEQERSHLHLRNEERREGEKNRDLADNEENSEEENIQYQAGFPFLEAHRIEDLTRDCVEEIEEQHGEIRMAVPLTGVEGEAWEAYVALQKKSLARQQLIFDLHNDPEFYQQYLEDEAFRTQVWKERKLLPLLVQEERKESEEVHFAQVPAYQPFRKS